MELLPSAGIPHKSNGWPSQDVGMIIRMGRNYGVLTCASCTHTVLVVFALWLLANCFTPRCITSPDCK